MLIEFDPAKNEKNIRERGLDFNRARDFDFATAEIRPVWRNTEWRLVAQGHIDGRLHVLCYLKIDGGIRVVSLRKANQREVKSYEASRRNLEKGS